MQSIFSSCAISFFVHATEDPDRIFDGLTSVLRIDRSELSLEELEGYFGNHILSAKGLLVGKRANEIAVRIFVSMDDNSKKKFKTEIEKSIDEHDSLFLRIDRQGLRDSTLVLSDDEPIHIKLKPKNRSDRGTMLDTYRELAS